MGKLDSINHIVVLMLENRSFDHMLGFLYPGKATPDGQAFEGLTGDETNPDASGTPISVFPITSATPNAYFMPGADPGEGYEPTNSQLFGVTTAPAQEPPPATSNQGFVKDFAYTLARETKERPKEMILGTRASDIMGCFTPEMLPILSGLARGFAVCDHWFGSAPTETMPNRAFACAATSQGHMDDHTHSFAVGTIFGALGQAGENWRIYGHDQASLTRKTFPDTRAASDDHFGEFSDFQVAAAGGSLPAFTFLEPAFGGPGENDQHPVSDVALGERLIHDVYYALRNGPGWNQTLLIITYDEHGGCYDHVAPPWKAIAPDNSRGEFGFDFKRFGPRVPSVLVSPWIARGTVFRVPAGATPLDHTAILKTVEARWSLSALTERDGAACDLGAVLTLDEPRLDDPLDGVVVPVSSRTKPGADQPTHIQRIHADLAARLPVLDASGGVHHSMPALVTGADYDDYIRRRTAAWALSKARGHEPAR
jgi:phospholipase C